MPSTRAIVKVLLVTAATAAVLYLLYLVRSILGLVFISIFLAVAMGPAVDLYQHRARLPRGVAILFVYLTILGAIVGLGLLVVPPIVNGVNHFVGKVPTYVQDLRKNQTVRKYDNKYHVTEKLNKEAKKFVATDPVIVNGEMVAEYHKFFGSAALMAVNDIHARIEKKAEKK